MKMFAVTTEGLQPFQHPEVVQWLRESTDKVEVAFNVGIPPYFAPDIQPAAVELADGSLVYGWIEFVDA